MSGVILVKGDQLGREADVGAELLRFPAQDDLQLVLVDRGEWRRAEGAHLLALLRLFGRLVFTRQRLGANGDPAEVIATGKAGRPDGRLEPDLPKQLNGPSG